MIVLGIDTSCDDTSVGVLRDGRVLANVVSSQDEIHRDWGGVVPNLARRAHQENFPKVLQTALKRAQVSLSDLNVIAVTQGPGLAVSLEVGITQAKELTLTLNIPLVAVNHMEGHLLSPLIASRNDRAPLQIEEVTFPALGLLASGNHTEIVLIHELGRYEILGETVDDAFGEAFDKTARLLGLGFPGGAILSRMARQGNPDAAALPLPMRNSGDLNVSYSGLKTAVRHLTTEISGGDISSLTQSQVADIAAVFEKAAVGTILLKFRRALEAHPVRQIFLGGGAAANLLLRSELRKIAKTAGAKVYTPSSRKLCSDNGAMIAFVGWLKAQRGEFASADMLDRIPQLRLQ